MLASLLCRQCQYVVGARHVVLFAVLYMLGITLFPVGLLIFITRSASMIWEQLQGLARVALHLNKFLLLNASDF